MGEEANFDKLRRQIEEDELRDGLEIATKMTPIDFARAYGKGLQPQLVYYHIRRGHLKQYTCDCGRKVVDTGEARAFFDDLERKVKEKRSGVNHGKTLG